MKRLSVSLEVLWQGEDARGNDVEETHEFHVEADVTWPVDGEATFANVSTYCDSCAAKAAYAGRQFGKHGFSHTWEDLSSMERQTAKDMLGEAYQKEEEKEDSRRGTLHRELLRALAALKASPLESLAYEEPERAEDLLKVLRSMTRLARVRVARVAQ